MTTWPAVRQSNASPQGSTCSPGLDGERSARRGSFETVHRPRPKDRARNEERERPTPTGGVTDDRHEEDREHGEHEADRDRVVAAKIRRAADGARPDQALVLGGLSRGARVSASLVDALGAVDAPITLGARHGTILAMVLVTFVILIVIKKTVGLRVDEQDESVGLDQSSHGETAYNN